VFRHSARIGAPNWGSKHGLNKTAPLLPLKPTIPRNGSAATVASGSVAWWRVLWQPGRIWLVRRVQRLWTGNLWLQLHPLLGRGAAPPAAGSFGRVTNVMLPLLVSCVSAAMFAMLAEKMVVQLVIQIGDGRVCIYMLQQKLWSYVLGPVWFGC
jgi:hypothetical protein